MLAREAALAKDALRQRPRSGAGRIQDVRWLRGGRRNRSEMKDRASVADERIWNGREDTVRVASPREVCEAISDMIATGGCGCDACVERLAQAEAWEGVFGGMAETETGMFHEVAPGQGGKPSLNGRFRFWL